jgi:hypothetical protein
VYAISSRPLGFGHLLAQTCKICSKNRRSESYDSVLHFVNLAF